MKNDQGLIQQRKLSLRKTILFYFLMVVGCFSAVFLLGEIFVRLFTNDEKIPEPPRYASINPYRENPYIVNMRPYIYFHIPGSRYSQKIGSDYENEYRINSSGFRGDDIPAHPAPGRKRLIVIGDSVVEGHGVKVSETFSSGLQEKLEATGWEVVNLGVQGASPLYFAANLERYLYFNPAAVLLVINENDLHEDEMREKSYFNLPVLGNRKNLYDYNTLPAITDRSRLLLFLKTRKESLFQSRLEQLIAENVEAVVADAKQKLLTNNEGSSFAIPPSEIDRRWNMSRRYLEYLLSRLREKDIDVMLSSLCMVTLASRHNQRYKEYCSNLESRVKQWAEMESVPFMSLASVMRRALHKHKQSDILIHNDLHPTPLTHRIFTDALYPFVSQELNKD